MNRTERTGLCCSGCSQDLRRDRLLWPTDHIRELQETADKEENPDVLWLWDQLGEACWVEGGREVQGMKVPTSGVGLPPPPPPFCLVYITAATVAVIPQQERDIVWFH